MRVALRQPIEAGATKVLITPLEETDLGNDILLRLAKRRLFQIDSWQIVRSLFQARAVDPGLTRHGWIADRLLERIPTEGYPAARGGFLDAETVWPILLRQELGLSAEPPDLTSLLRWSRDTAATGRFRDLPETSRKGVTEWLVEKIGQVAAVILRGVIELEPPDAVPLGLASSVVFHSETTGRLERAAGKLEERYLGGRTEELSLLRRWSSAATEVVRALRHTDSKAYRQIILPVDTPAWWDEPIATLTPAEQPTRTLKPTQPRTTGMLFDLEAENETATPASTDEPVPEWVGRLVCSSVFSEQKEFAGRGVPLDDLFIRLLGALDRRGGKMTSVALARALRFPTLRLPGLLAKMQRILNVDGYPVLSRDDASDTVELNRDLLLKQFDLV